MKPAINAVIIFFFSIQLTGGCISSPPSPAGKSGKTVIDPVNAEKSADQLYSEGMDILEKRLSVQSSNNKEAMELNRRAIQKFNEAHELDASLRDPVFFASECTMFARDYDQCMVWTKKLEKLETSEAELAFCKERIAYCAKKLRSTTGN
ncbi:MAG: hypothetical protein JWQ27_75 [Ferruginibacter sp.]|nr:hypothetical protein [Ferruginibacter sp.]